MPSLGANIVATVTPRRGESKMLVYDDTTPSGILVSDSTASAGIALETHYLEQITESVERSRGLLDGGFKFGFKFPDKLGGGSLEFERKPREERKTTTKAIYKPQKR